MGYEGLTTEYLCYLMNRIGLEAEGEDGYLRLCETLQEIEFLPQTDMDENRCGDCLELRSDFAEYEDDPGMAEALDDILSVNGTMLELLTVLAEMMRFEMCDSQFEAATRKWFREMLKTCGLDKHWTNGDFGKEGNEETVIDTIHTVMFRLTGWDGEGGFFPLTSPPRDQRRAEFVIQMNDYLAENYDI